MQSLQIGMRVYKRLREEESGYPSDLTHLSMPGCQDHVFLVSPVNYSERIGQGEQSVRVCSFALYAPKVWSPIARHPRTGTPFPPGQVPSPVMLPGNPYIHYSDSSARSSGLKLFPLSVLVRLTYDDICRFVPPISFFLLQNNTVCFLQIRKIKYFF